MILLAILILSFCFLMLTLIRRSWDRMVVLSTILIRDCFKNLFLVPRSNSSSISKPNNPWQLMTKWVLARITSISTRSRTSNKTSTAMTKSWACWSTISSVHQVSTNSISDLCSPYRMLSPDLEDNTALTLQQVVSLPLCFPWSYFKALW